MSENSREPPTPDTYRARPTRLWVILAVEAGAILLLVVGVWWFIRRYEAGGPVARMLLDPGLWVIVIIATAVGVLGNLALYYLGQRGSDEVFTRFPNLQRERWDRIGAYYQRYGARVLILSGVPGLGTLLTTGAGAFDIKRSPFLFWVFVGKMLRNWLILLLFYQASNLVTG